MYCTDATDYSSEWGSKSLVLGEICLRSSYIQVGDSHLHTHM